MPWGVFSEPNASSKSRAPSAASIVASAGPARRTAQLRSVLRALHPPELDPGGHQPHLTPVVLHLGALGFEMRDLFGGQGGDLERPGDARLGASGVGGDEEAVVLEGDPHALAAAGGSELHPAAGLLAGAADDSVHQHHLAVL